MIGQFNHRFRFSTNWHTFLPSGWLLQELREKSVVRKSFENMPPEFQCSDEKK